MAVLLTGGAGYIGSHICVELLRSGEEVVIFDDLSNAKADVPARIARITGRAPTFFKGDVLDPAALARVFSENEISAVIHLAGLKAVGESVEKPLAYYKTNIAGTINLLEAMGTVGCYRLVFSSSATVYGLCERVPLREDSPLGATSPYGATKLFLERILTDLAASDTRWQLALLRYFNPVGADESGLIGDDPNGLPNNLMPILLQVVTGRRAELSVYGGDYPTPDGTGVRDYLHVIDLARGHLAALAALKAGAQIYNLGTGQGYSVLQMADAMQRASGRPVPRRIVARRPGDVAVSLADPAKAERLLGWKAKKTLDDMCVDSWRFAKSILEGE